MATSSPGSITAPLHSTHAPREKTKAKPRLELVVDSVLARAEASIALQKHTIVDVLHHRAFRHYAEGLRQYVTIRSGSVSSGQRAMKKLKAVVASKASDALVEPPGIRARLYRLARDLAEPVDDGDFLPYRIPREGKRAARVQRLRDHVPAEDAELLELRFARELGPTEIAFVLGAPVEGVLESLHDATAHAAKIARTKPGDSLRRLLAEAFALEASIQTTRDVEDYLEEQPALSPGKLIGSRYRIQARVGTGAFGDVYRAEDADVPGHVVALKLLHQPAYSDEARRGALRELQHLASVFHPSVVHLKDHGWHDGRLWFVMPWYDGETLESRLQAGPLERHEARRIFEQLARALAAVHAAGLRHQDVKPENVFLAELPGDEEPLPVLIDFGVSATDAEMLVAGTPTYFAPEVAAQFASVESKPRVTSRADVFSLALALRNALDPETQDDVPSGAVDSFIEERARKRPSAPTQRSLRFLESSFDRWMHLDPFERPTAEELAEQLAILTAPEERRARRWRLLRWVLPLLIVVGAAFAGAWWHFEQRNAATQEQAQAQLDQVREETDAERDRIASHAEQIRLSLQREQLDRAQLESQLATTQATLGAERSRTELMRQQVRDERFQAESDRTAAAEALANANRRIDELRDESRGLRGSLETFQRQSREASAELARIRSTRHDLETRLTQAQIDIEQRDADLGRERTRRAEAEARLESLERERDEAVAARQAALEALTGPTP